MNDTDNAPAVVAGAPALADSLTEEATLRALKDLIDHRYKNVRTRNLQLLEAQHKATGAASFDATAGDNDVKVATVSLKGAEVAAKVIDEEAFRAWVRTNAPTEITSRLVVEVREAYVKRILAQMTKTGAAVIEVADETTGEVVEHQVPGVELLPSTGRTHQVRFTPTGREDIAVAWRGQHLANVLPELEGP
jgi:hypothetical protein